MKTPCAIAVLAGLACVPAAAATLHVVERAQTDATHVHGGTAADNVGDILTFSNPIFDAANASKVGSDQGYCVRLVVDKAWECHFTVLLADGQIAVDGPFYDNIDSVMVIVGGSGKYAGARGTMGLHMRDAKGTAFDFAFDILAK